MPSLKDLNCSIELSDSQQALQEFGTIYGDGFVETFVPVPSKPQSFLVHLTSNKFIAPGVAIFVYVDGVYQCNRNRQDLKLRKPSESRSVVDFRVRQKEEKQKDGSMIAREWTFDKLNIASADDAPNLCSPNILENIGCIEVVVLRCAGPRNAKTASTMNLDGASDFPDHHFGLDGKPSGTSSQSMYDDRGPFAGSFGNGYGPPPPISSYHSPYAETVHSYEGTTNNRRSSHADGETSPLASITRRSRPHSRHSEPISPGARRTSNLPSLGVQYGSGPIPRDGDPFHSRPPSVVVTNAPGVDPVWLNSMLKTAVKQGLEESRWNEGHSKRHFEQKQRTPDVEIASQPPGAWPTSPFSAPAQSYQQSEPVEYSKQHVDEDHGSAWGQSQDDWDRHPTRSRAGTRVTWNAEPVWEHASSVSGWNSREETPSDSWDTDETGATNKATEWEAASQQGRFGAPTIPSRIELRSPSPISVRTPDRRHSKDTRRGKSRSMSRSRHPRREIDMTPSDEEEDNEGWTHVDPAPYSVASLTSSNDTLQPSHSRSQVHTPRSRSEKRSRHSKSALDDHERMSSRHTQKVPTWQPTETLPMAPAPSVTTRITSTVMNAAPPAIYPTQVRSRKASVFADPAVSVVPPPGWGSAISEKARKTSSASMAPAPYAPSLVEFVRSTLGGKRAESRSTSSSSWGSGKNSDAAKGFWGDKAEKKADWGDDGDSSWGKKEPSEQIPNGWEATEDEQKGAWNKTDNVKDAQAGGWDAKSTGCNEKDGSKKAEKPDAANAWDSKNPSWDAREASKKEEKVDVADAWALTKNDQNNSKQVEAPWEAQTWNSQDNNDSSNNIKWDTANPWPPDPAPATASDKPANAASTSRRHSNKSLSKYRQLRPTSSELTPKPHWQFPPPPSEKKLYPTFVHRDRSRISYVAPKEPRYTISKEAASEKGVEHQVRAGKAMEYGHAVGRPEYLDRLDKPYAVFRFKYRSRAILKSLFGDQVPDHGHLTEPTPSSTLAKAQEKLKDLPQDELIKKMLKLQTKLEQTKSSSKEHEYKEHKHRHHKHKENERRPSESKTEVVAKNLTEKWVEQHSRDPSEKGKGKSEKEVGREKKDAKESREQTGGGDGGWGKGVTW
ncbi:hypothetical protein EJ02DRAFT_402093 [Clathrospora elynae]|uniref:DUF7918 domain-containing protein n=1 Tax=Clathrospora elynae TaxID=706981 RepID=A0A6A5SSL9_9PLEO|nr:hypothetical protein EJ02DRAFT_402093 [Clathrospora elynae]